MLRFLIAVVLVAIPALADSAIYQGRSVHFTVHGKGGRTVILLHGWTCDESFWDNQVAALSKKNRVITIDLPGHGQSQPPGQAASPCTTHLPDSLPMATGPERARYSAGSLSR